MRRIGNALKHGGYTATTLLPGEDRGAFEELHQALIAELAPVGALEEDTVSTIARVLWRKKNLSTFQRAALARDRLDEIKYEQEASHNPYVVEALENDRAAQAQARKELGDTFDLIEVGKKTTFDGLMEDLTVEERLDAIVDKCLKRLLMLKGVKSLNGSSQNATPPTNPKMIQSA
jgi:hypothetical protein